MADYYEVLSIERTASEDEIKGAYRKLAMRWHPDRNNGSKESEEKFKELTEAYREMIDEWFEGYDQDGFAAEWGTAAERGAYRSWREWPRRRCAR